MRRRAGALATLVASALISLAACASPQGPPAGSVDSGPRAADPTGVDVSAVGIHATDLVKLGLDEDDELQIPDDATVTGWYPLGPAPGDPGPAILAAHVNYGGVPGVFARLKDVEPGSEIVVHRADATSVTFVVDRVQSFPKTALPTEQIYGNTDGPELRLITCGGKLDRATRSYVDNVVVFARLQT